MLQDPLSCEVGEDNENSILIPGEATSAVAAQGAPTPAVCLNLANSLDAKGPVLPSQIPTEGFTPPPQQVSKHRIGSWFYQGVHVRAFDWQNHVLAQVLDFLRLSRSYFFFAASFYINPPLPGMNIYN